MEAATASAPAWLGFFILNSIRGAFANSAMPPLLFGFCKMLSSFTGGMLTEIVAKGTRSCFSEHFNKTGIPNEADEKVLSKLFKDEWDNQFKINKAYMHDYFMKIVGGVLGNATGYAANGSASSALGIPTSGDTFLGFAIPDDDVGVMTARAADGTGPTGIFLAIWFAAQHLGTSISAHLPTFSEVMRGAPLDSPSNRMIMDVDMGIRTDEQEEGTLQRRSRRTNYHNPDVTEGSSTGRKLGDSD